MAHRVFVTGCSGYLAQRLIQTAQQNRETEWIGGIDVRRPPQNVPGFHFFEMDVRSKDLASVLQEQKVDTLVHLAWIFNPTHNPQLEYEVDVNGTRNVLESAKKANVPYLIYLSSTTSYGPHPENPEIFDENYPRRGHSGYLYSKYKAEVDHIMLEFIDREKQMRVFMARAPIVLGPHTENVVTKMTQLPMMFGVSGYDPPMQFLHEEDLQRLLLWAVQEQPVGVFNISGHGTIRYSEIIRLLKRHAAWVPASVIYPAVSILWKLRLVPFPPSILDFIRYPWVADSSKFEAAYPLFRVQHSSKDAFIAYGRAHWPNLS